MKQIIAGASIMLTGALFFLSVCTVASGLGRDSGYLGLRRFVAAMSDNGLVFVLVISVLLVLAGAALLLYGLLEKKDK